eukprot:364740-Chlamydomonas_euryale.AAC.1
MNPGQRSEACAHPPTWFCRSRSRGLAAPIHMAVPHAPTWLRPPALWRLQRTRGWRCGALKPAVPNAVPPFPANFPPRLRVRLRAIDGKVGSVVAGEPAAGVAHALAEGLHVAVGVQVVRQLGKVLDVLLPRRLVLDQVREGAQQALQHGKEARDAAAPELARLG